MNWENLLLNTFFAFLSAIAGVLLGVWHNARQVRRQEAKDRERLRRELVQAFRFNIDRLRQIQGQLATNVVPDFRLDTESVAHILFHGRQLFDGGDWFDRFNWQRFQLCHLNARIDFLNEVLNVATAPGPEATSAAAVAAHRYSSVAHQAEVAAREISTLLDEYGRAATGPQ